MDNHLYILFIRQLLACQIVKLSLVKHPFNQITCRECSIPLGNRRLRQQSQTRQNSCIQHFPGLMNEKRKQKLLNMRTHPPKNQPAGPQPCACPVMWQSLRSTLSSTLVSLCLPPQGSFLCWVHSSGDHTGQGTTAVLWPISGSEGLWPHTVRGKLSSLMHYYFLREPVGVRSCNSFKRFKSVAFMKCYFHRLYFLGILIICSVMYTPHIAKFLWPIGM